MLGDVDVRRGGDLAGDDAETGGHERLARHAPGGILGEHGVEDGVRDLVGDLVGMPLGDGFGGEDEIAHGRDASRKPPAGPAVRRPDRGLCRAIRWLISPRRGPRGRRRPCDAAVLRVAPHGEAAERLDVGRDVRVGVDLRARAGGAHRVEDAGDVDVGQGRDVVADAGALLEVLPLVASRPGSRTARHRRSASFEMAIDVARLAPHARDSPEKPAAAEALAVRDVLDAQAARCPRRRAP